VVVGLLALTAFSTQAPASGAGTASAQ